jgi:hypothetical protein
MLRKFHNLLISDPHSILSNDTCLRNTDIRPERKSARWIRNLWGDLSAFLSLDSEREQVFTAYANADSGATVWAANEKHDAIAFSTHNQPVFEIIQNKKIIYKEPITAPDLHQ